MKFKVTKFIFGGLLFIFTFSSCTQSEDLYSIQNDADIMNVGGMLKFKNEAVFNATLDTLSKMSISQQNKYLSTYEFESYRDIYDKANNELESLINSVTNKETFDPIYAVYKNKYQTLFLFSNPETEFISPILKLKKCEFDMIVNSHGEYMIGDKVMKAEMYNTIDEYNSDRKRFVFDYSSDIAGLQKVVTSSTANYGYVKTTDRKAIIEISLSGLELKAYLSAQYKSFLGYWASVYTIFHVQFDLNKSFFLNGNGVAIAPNTPMMYTNNETFNYNTISLGYFSPGDETNISGHFLMWTRGISSADGVQGTISF